MEKRHMKNTSNKKVQTHVDMKKKRKRKGGAKRAISGGTHLLRRRVKE